MLSGAAISTVNLAEVQGKLVNRRDAWQAPLAATGEAVPCTSEHARLASEVTTRARPFGLSLGDRACLALGLALKAPVYTADKS